MEVENRHKANKDIFSCAIRKKVENYPLPVSEDDWLYMQGRIRKEKRKKFLLRIGWISMTSAAAILLLLLYVAPIYNAVQEEAVPFLAEEVIPESGWQEEIEESIPKPDIVSKELIVQITKPRRKEIEEKEKMPQEEPTVEKQDSSFAQEGKAEEKLLDSTGKEKTVTTQKDFFPMEESLAWTDLPVKTKRKKWSFATGISTGTNVDLSLEDREYIKDNLGNSIDYEGGGEEEENGKDEVLLLTRGGRAEIQNLLDEGDYYHTQHSIPVTVGFTFRASVSDRLALETGLVYTYLTSIFSKNHKDYYHARVKQHYLGVPFNLIWKMADYSRWHFYLSAGGMIEKGIYLSLDERYWKDGVEKERRTTSGISSIQASLQVSLGLEYRLSREWGLYVEPRISYYIRNGQPISIRTEHPLAFGIGGGIRYTLK